MTKTINLRDLTWDQLYGVATVSCAALVEAANNLTTDEGDPDTTEDEFGLETAEVIEFAHDDMIFKARDTLHTIQLTLTQESLHGPTT